MHNPCRRRIEVIRCCATITWGFWLDELKTESLLFYGHAGSFASHDPGKEVYDIAVQKIQAVPYGQSIAWGLILWRNSQHHFSRRIQLSLKRERISMKARSIICRTAGALVVGILTALPAYAGSGLNNLTHGSRWNSAQPKSSAVAKAQPTASQAKPKVQVAVMATSPSQPAARPHYHICR
jgi:hypothetical protein